MTQTGEAATIDCETVRPRLVALMDGETDREETSALIAHLRTCAECEALRRQYSQLLFRGANEPIETADITDRVLARLEDRTPRTLSPETQLLLTEIRALHTQMAAMQEEIRTLRAIVEKAALLEPVLQERLSESERRNSVGQRLLPYAAPDDLPVFLS